jgi:hypothetical protein
MNETTTETCPKPYPGRGNYKNGLSGTAEYRARYYQTVAKARQAQVRLHPELKRCDCGNQASVYRLGEFVCARCDALEKLYDFWHVNKKAEHAIGQNISPLWLLRKLQAWQEDVHPYIEDLPGEIVVHGHGHYHLPVVIKPMPELDNV